MTIPSNPTHPAPPAEMVAFEYAQWLRDATWREWELHPAGLTCVYEDDLSVEDLATDRDVVILRSKDGRVWHARITIDVQEQTTRTPVPDLDGDE